MALIATISGKPVYSDKQVVAINNTRITFTDGSWCDVSTGEVHNVGSGYITLGGTGSASDAKEVTEDPKPFAASALAILGAKADFRVEVYSGSDIECTLTGTPDQISNIHTYVEADTLIIESDNSSASGSGDTTVIGNGSHMVIAGNIVVGDYYAGSGFTTVIGNANRAKVVVKVPSGTPVETDRVNGNVTIGDIDGPLVVTTDTQDVRAGKVTSTRLNTKNSGSIFVAKAAGTVEAITQSSGNIRIREVSGNVTGVVSSSGSITIERGSIPRLEANVRSSGNLTFGGSATDADLSTSSIGNITVTHVQRRLTRNCTSIGRIRIDHVG